MKQLFLTLAGALLSYSSYAQWLGTSPVYYNGGNVGIGTTTPTAKLHIASGNNIFKFNDGSGNLTPNLSIGTSGGKSLAVVAGTMGTATVFDNSGMFYIGVDTKANIDGGTTGGGTPYLSVTGSGNVGIGTTSPEVVLDVASNVQDSPINSLASSANGQFSLGRGNSANSEMNFGTSGGGYGWIQMRQRGGGSSFPLVINPLGGSVGIGTSTPAGQLHVVAPLDNSLSSIVIGDASTGNLNVPVGAATGGYNIDFHGYRDVVPEQIGARIRAERINNYQANTALVQAMDLVFYTSNGGDQSQLSEKMRINYDGTVGINTASTHGYMFGVNGSAIATSMTVKLPGQWGDYIFDKAYQLPSLNDIKSYIAQNHHLPDMPSAKEVEEKGINLGDIVTTQTKKIEELTLYLIDKDKQLTDQNAKIEEQQKEINLLKQQQEKSKLEDERINALEQALEKLTSSK